MVVELLQLRKNAEGKAGFDGIAGLLNASAGDMALVKGLGPAKRAELIAVLELARRALAQQLQQREVFASPGAVRQYLQLHLAAKRHEVFAVIFMDVQNRLLAMEEMFRGTLTQTSVYPLEIVLRALHHSARPWYWRTTSERVGATVTCRRGPDANTALRVGADRRAGAGPRDRGHGGDLVDGRAGAVVRRRGNLAGWLAAGDRPSAFTEVSGLSDGGNTILWVIWAPLRRPAAMGRVRPRRGARRRLTQPQHAALLPGPARPSAQ